MTESLPPWPDAVEGESGNRSRTTLGTLGSTYDATVDDQGLVCPGPAAWSLDWWVGAEDKWHRPSESANVRQALIADSPVVETRMRVPGGDIIHRSYAIKATAADGAREFAIIEIENDSAVPVALAFVIQAVDPDGIGPVGQIDILETSIVVDGRTSVVLPREPNEWTLDDVAARAMFAYPLPHHATIQVALPLDPAPPPTGLLARLGRTKTEDPVDFPRAVPTAEQVANGWRAQTDRGTRLVLPDERLQAAVDANRRSLLLLADRRDGDFRDTAHRLAALDHYGFHREVGEFLLDDPDHWDDEGAALWALGHHWDLTRNDALAVELATMVAATIARLGRRRRRDAGDRDGAHDAWALAGLRAGASVLAAAGEDHAAMHTAGLADELAADVATEPPAVLATPGGLDDLARAIADLLDGDRRALTTLDDVLAAAPSTWSWSRPVSAQFLSLVRSMLVRETDEGLALCSMIPERWYGQGVEVHDAPTRLGTVSMAVRWHGARPALLWEIDRHDPAVPVTLTCPGLDSTWRTTEERGEALLEAPTVSVAPGPDAGDSFG